jgi:hypothetical protein
VFALVCFALLRSEALLFFFFFFFFFSSSPFPLLGGLGLGCFATRYNV